MEHATKHQVGSHNFYSELFVLLWYAVNTRDYPFQGSKEQVVLRNTVLILNEGIMQQSAGN